MTADSAAIREFTIDIDQADLDDLRERLSRTRWPDAQPTDDWSYGLPLDYAQELARYWRDDFDWRAVEAQLNSIPQFHTTIDGTGVHFLHLRSDREDATPLLITHGWPGSIVEFLDVLGPLTDPPADQPAFHVVAPTLPGFGFSGHTTEPGWGPARVARAWAELMQRLRYPKYVAHGGDWGAIVTHQLMRTAPDALLGAHVTMLLSAVPRPGSDLDAIPGMTDEDRAKAQRSMEKNGAVSREERGYGSIQSTKPQTLAYGLADSPAGQLCWIMEKFRTWTDNDGLPEQAVRRELLLANVALYWFTNTAGSSARIYWERMHSEDGWTGTPARSEVPLALLAFPKEISLPIRPLAEQFDNVVRWTEAEHGGHFAALEHPEQLVGDIREFVSGLSTD